MATKVRVTRPRFGASAESGPIVSEAVGPGAGYLASPTHVHGLARNPNVYTDVFGRPVSPLLDSEGGPSADRSRRWRASADSRRTIRFIDFSRRTSAAW